MSVYYEWSGQCQDSILADFKGYCSIIIGGGRWRTISNPEPALQSLTAYFVSVFYLKNQIS
jgi:hypothetical protein